MAETKLNAKMAPYPADLRNSSTPTPLPPSARPSSLARRTQIATRRAGLRRFRCRRVRRHRLDREGSLLFIEYDVTPQGEIELVALINAVGGNRDAAAGAGWR